MGAPAARVGDNHDCPMVNPGGAPHVGGPILPAGATTVLIGKMPAARIGDRAFCQGPPDMISQGEVTVLIEGRPAARVGDGTIHGGVITAGCDSVQIGFPPQVACTEAAAAAGAPFVAQAQP